MTRTPNFGFNMLGPLDKASDDDYKFGVADRLLEDYLLNKALTRRPGDTGTTPVAPSAGPSLSMSPTGGLIPAGVRVYYKYTLVALDGQETAASPESFIDTPSAISSPGPPSVASLSTTGGTLPGGNYYYAVSAWAGSNTSESLASGYGSIVAPNSPTNIIRLTLPSLPAGASGFDIYRRKPGQSKFFFLTSITGTGPTFDDNGTVADDCDRTLPVRNTTNGTNSITITYPTATPVVPVGFTWKIYRTTTPGNYSGSLLHHVVEETSEGSGVITPRFIDVGSAVSAGSPPTSAPAIPAYPKVNLSNAVEVMGALPVGMLSGHVVVFTFEMPGTAAVATHDTQWAFPFPKGKIAGALVNTGPSLGPTGADLLVDINKNGTTIYTDQTHRPKVAATQEVGAALTANADVAGLVFGDKLSVDVDQVGSTLPGSNVLVQVIVLVQYGSTTTSETYA